MVSRIPSQRIRIRMRGLKHKQAEARNKRVKIPFLHRGQLRVLVPKCDKVPKRGHFYQLGIKLLLYFFKENFEMGGHVFDGPSVEQDKIKHFGTFVDIFLPLCLFGDAAPSLR